MEIQENQTENISVKLQLYKDQMVQGVDQLKLNNPSSQYTSYQDKIQDGQHSIQKSVKRGAATS